MRIAVTYENGKVFEHFGRTENFIIYDVEDGAIVDSKVISTNGQGHGALAVLLAESDVDVLICGGIGGGAQMALAQAGIKICAGVYGNVDVVIKAFLKDELSFTLNATCNHHGEGHEHHGNCGSGGCGSHSCGH